MGDAEEDTLADYISALLPLVGGMLLVPVRDKQDVPPVLLHLYSLSPLADERLLAEHFTFTERAFKDGRWWTA
jgi:hypothetical protein